MTYKDAIRKGYRNADSRFHRGYVSRKIDPEKQEVKAAGGSRKGQLYVELPSWKSTRYFIRQYLTK